MNIVSADKLFIFLSSSSDKSYVRAMLYKVSPFETVCVGIGGAGLGVTVLLVSFTTVFGCTGIGF